MNRRLVHKLTLCMSALALTRPWNSLSAGMATLVGISLADAAIPAPNAAAAMATAALITAAGNVTNDYFDRAIDAINKPRRPLPAGRIPPQHALILAAALCAIGEGCAVVNGPLSAAIVASIAVLAYLYSAFLKRSFLAGNVLVAVLSSLTVVYGSFVGGRVSSAMLASLLVFAFILSREVLKTVEDHLGDAAHGVQTVAVVIGKSAAARSFALGAVAVAVMVYLPWIGGQVTSVYSVLVTAGVAPVLLVSAAVLWPSPSQQRITAVLAATKTTFFVWLAAMLVGTGAHLR